MRTFEFLAVEPLHGGGGGERVLVGDRAVTFQLTCGLVLVQPHLQGKASHIEIQWLQRRQYTAAATVEVDYSGGGWRGMLLAAAAFE